MKPPFQRGSQADADLFRSRLEQIINMRHELVRLAGLVDWSFFDTRFQSLYAEAGRPGVPTRLMVGLHLLKHMHGLSDEAVCERWVPKVYSLHAPEVECIGKGKAHKPYEFGCKVSVATTNARSPAGQFVVHIDALHGNPYDGHTLKAAVEGAEAWTGVTVKRIYVDKGYRGHGLDRFKVWRSGNKAPTEAIRRELRRRSAIEPVIGHMKNDGLLDRNFLKGKDGDRINAILSGAGHNFRLLLKWLRLLLSLILETMRTISREPQVIAVTA